MPTSNKILVTDQDYERLTLLANQSGGEFGSMLEDELARAEVLPQKDIPEDVVTMNSKIKFCDENTGKETELTLVYPKDADVTKGQISILAPVGMALIGLRKNETIDWLMPNGKVRKLKVISILYQPESEGHWNL